MDACVRHAGRGGGRDGGAPSTASRAAAALQLLASAREAVDGGQHEQVCVGQCWDGVVHVHDHVRSVCG